MNICLIPARGGSKRIKDKNIRLFAGKPMIAHAIAVAYNSGIFDRIVVSTDSEAIASIAKKFGAEVPFIRPDELADDFTGTMPVINHAINTLQDLGWQINFICCLYPTTPLLRTSELLSAWHQLQTGAQDLVFTATSFEFPVQRALRLTGKGGVEPYFPNYIKDRSQDLEPLYHDAGQFYFATCRRFLDGPGVFHPTSIPLILPRHQVVDIDTEEDWILAEALHQVRAL